MLLPHCDDPAEPPQFPRPLWGSDPRQHSVSCVGSEAGPQVCTWNPLPLSNDKVPYESFLAPEAHLGTPLPSPSDSGRLKGGALAQGRWHVSQHSP